VIDDGHIYILNDPGVAECFELESGKLIWEERLRGRQRSRTTGRQWFSQPENLRHQPGGDAFVLKASPKSRCWRRIPREATIASMAVSDGDLFVRTHRALWCFRERPEVTTVVQASDADAVAQARELFCEYATEAQLDLCFQELRGRTGGSARRVCAAGDDCCWRSTKGNWPGVWRLRKFENGVCEMKRLFVRPAFRGSASAGRLPGV